MKRYVSFVLVIGIIVLTVLGACAPKTSPVAPPAPVANTPATPPTVAAPTSNLPPIRQAQGMPPTSQDVAWAKVVEAAKKEGRVNAYSYTWVGDAGLAISRALRRDTASPWR